MFPPVLHLQLMRFQYDPMTDANIKLNDRLVLLVYEHHGTPPPILSTCMHSSYFKKTLDYMLLTGN